MTRSPGSNFGIDGLKLKPQHLPELTLHENDPHVILRVHHVLLIEPEEHTIQYLVVSYGTHGERFNDIGIAYNDKIPRSKVINWHVE